VIHRRASNAAGSRAGSVVPLLILTLWSTTPAAPVLAQQPSRPVIGDLASSSYLHPDLGGLFFGQMARPGGFGLYAGANILFRSGAGSDSRLPGLAKELIDARVGIIVAEGVPAVMAAKAATRSIMARTPRRTSSGRRSGPPGAHWG
jgi:hypothetical protein